MVLLFFAPHPPRLLGHYNKKQKAYTSYYLRRCNVRLVKKVRPLGYLPFIAADHRLHKSVLRIADQPDFCSLVTAQLVLA